jgi:hypothetical protein
LHRTFTSALKAGSFHLGSHYFDFFRKEFCFKKAVQGLFALASSTLSVCFGGTRRLMLFSLV